MSNHEPFPNEGWTALSGADREAFLAQVNALQEKFSFSGEGVFVHWRPVPFYPRCALIRLTDTDWSPLPLTLWFVGQGGSLTMLDGTSRPIHDLNQKAGIELTPETILDYLRFFCFFVHGDAGPFHIVETVEDLGLLGSLTDGQRLQLEEALFAPLLDERTGDGGSFFISANILYGDTLYRAKFRILPTGPVEMLEDESLFGGLVTAGNMPQL